MGLGRQLQLKLNRATFIMHVSLCATLVYIVKTPDQIQKEGNKYDEFPETIWISN